MIDEAHRNFHTADGRYRPFAELLRSDTASSEDVQRVAKKYVPYDNVQIVAVGDGDKIRELLKKFGPVMEITPDSN